MAQQRMTKQALLACAIAAVCAVPATKAQELPSCKSDWTTASFIKAINNSPPGRVGGLEALDLRYSIEVYTSKESTLRLCEGQAFLNIGKQEYYVLLEREDDGTTTLTTMTERAIRQKARHWSDAITGCIRDMCRINVSKQGKIGKKSDGTEKTDKDGACIIFCETGFIMKIEQ
jgi:hypothetical protein